MDFWCLLVKLIEFFLSHLNSLSKLQSAVLLHIRDVFLDIILNVAG
jgi:hypothetical protein